MCCVILSLLALSTQFEHGSQLYNAFCKCALSHLTPNIALPQIGLALVSFLPHVGPALMSLPCSITAYHCLTSGQGNMVPSNSTLRAWLPLTGHLCSSA